MEFNYGELVAIYHALQCFKLNESEITFSNKNGLVEFEPVKITELMKKVKTYGESLEPIKK